MSLSLISKKEMGQREQGEGTQTRQGDDTLSEGNLAFHLVTDTIQERKRESGRAERLRAGETKKCSVLLEGSKRERGRWEAKK